MKKGKVKVYELNSDGKYVIGECNNYDTMASNDRINSMTLDNKENTEGLPKEVFQQLFTNPFLFIKDDTNEKYITSLEDFYVTYKNTNESLGAILRSNEYKKSKIRKLFKKQFKIWRHDATKVKNDTFKEIEASLQLAKEHKPIAVGFGIKFGLIIGIAIPLFLSLNIVPWLTLKTMTIKIIAWSVMILATIGLILSLIKDIKNLNFKNFIKKQKLTYQKYLKDVNKNLKKKSTKVQKYYSSALNKKKFIKAPVPIEKITVGGEKVEYLRKQITVINKRTTDMINKNKRFNGLYSFPLLLSVLTSIPSIGYLIYLCILKLIDYFK